MTSPAVTTRVHLGSHQFDCPIILAPMAGVSDRPFRDVCRRLGADYAVAEMVSSRPELWRRAGTRRRLDFAGEAGLRVAQIAGADPRQMADAARRAVDFGADVVDINMGCPAKKVCNQLAGSALLRDEALVGRILDAVCGAVPVPVTLQYSLVLSSRRRPAAQDAVEQMNTASGLVATLPIVFQYTLPLLGAKKQPGG